MVCLFVITSPSRAQTYDFQNLTVEEGLSQSQVLCLFQISTGELWMGTNQGGISKYNGSEFSYLSKENGLSDNVVYAITQEKNGRILVGTNNGLNLISGDRIDTMNTDKGLPHKGVVSLLISKREIVWIGTGRGVAQLVGDTIILFAEDSLLSTSTVLNMREGSNGTLWFCTVQNGVFRWNGESMLNISTSDGLKHNYVYDVMPFGKYDAWIFGYNGFYHLKDKLVEPKTLHEKLHESTVYYGYVRDKAKNIWIGTSAGVLKYRDGTFITKLTKENGLVNNDIWKLLQDREGNLWFGSKSIGASKLNSERFKIYQSKNDILGKTVNAVHRDQKGRFWLGTKRGLAIWDSADTSFIEEQNGLISEVVRDIDESENGNIYIATNYGLTVYANEKFAGYTSEENALNSIYDVFVDDETIWLGTNKGPVVFQNGKISHILNSDAFNATVFDAIRAGDNIWFAYDDGVLKFDGKQFVQLRKKDGFFNGRTRSVVVGPNGNLWFGTNNGVYRYDGKECVNFGVKDGLISDAVYSLGFDSDGSLWVGQAKGVTCLSFYKNELEDVIRYGKGQGFLGLECSTNSILMGDDGKIWIGTTNGLVEYDPSLDKGAYFEPLTRLTGIKLFSQDIDWLLYTDSVQKDGLPVTLELPYDQNHLTFEFSGVSLTAPISINYSFMLEGADEDWSPITNDNKAVYTNIAPGNYTFKVRAGFGDELWQNRPVLFRFSVKPPFYRTTWFDLMLLTVALGIAYSYYKIRRSNVKIMEQNQEIELQKDVIQKKNQEMVDSINYARTIQSATLPTTEQWHKLLPDSFVLFKPKDIVSGDFYWLANQGDEIFFSAVDCTGHGVPGALMSIVGYNGLNQAVNEHKLSDPASILRNLSSSVNESLRKSEHDDYVKDGMDIALCKLNFKTLKLEFAGAFNPLLIIRNGEEILTKGDRISIGSMDTEQRSFQNHEVDLQKGDCIYIYSDGYADQFGGERGKKMKTTIMRKKVLELSSLPIKQQKIELEKYLQEWQGLLDQVDDICVIGLRV
jgi:ligand-binding sensor domain-containing protein/serine phosphatase RsbU (regulator of sigma subunit)